LRELRADPELVSTPIILLSARAGEEARIEGMQAGADDYLVKPFSARELLARVESHLRVARVREEATEALRHRTAQFETLLNQAPVGVFLVDADFRLRAVNPTARKAAGDIPGGLIGRDFEEIIHLVWEKVYADKLMGIFRRTLATGERYIANNRSEFRIDRGVTEHYEWQLHRIVLPDGEFGLVCYFRDIGEQVQAEATRQLLLQELNHRVKNTLASVQAIAQQTARSAKDPEEFAGRFTGRIQSLARVHSLLTDATWRGADLRTLIRNQLLEGAVDETRLTARGPAVQLGPQMAVHLSLMLHELGTNSVKYGALSAPEGRVTVTWSVADNVLRLLWVERGGPPVVAPFSPGFGTWLIEKGAKGEGGAAQMLCEAEGVSWDISVPLPQTGEAKSLSDHTLQQPNQKSGAGPRKQPRDDALAGRRFLVVEDEPLIAVNLVDTLKQAGAAQVQNVGTRAEALRVLEERKFDAVLLDANLHGSPVEEIADALSRRNVPFAFVTGYGRSALPAAFQDAPIVSKPFTEQQLLAAASSLVRKGGNVVRLNL
jgi:PAS domain S-box-containing protein